MSEELRDEGMRSETQISEQLDERLTMNDNKRYLLLNNNFNDITYHNYSNTQMKVYAKDSFDRFGDDLTEEILQYLILEDKVRLECVSKQWRRLVFNKQFEIIITPFDKNKKSINKVIAKTGTDDTKQLNERHLESVLKKCPNIKRVDFGLEVNSSVLSLIGRYCPNIKSLTYEYSNEEKSLDFYRMYGHKLEELILSHDNESNRLEDDEINEMINFIKFCPNLKIIYHPINSVLITEDKEYLPKLKSMAV